MKKWLKIDDGVIFLRYICRKGCIINQKGLKFGRKKQYLLGILCMFAVTSFAEVWIEMRSFLRLFQWQIVTSFAEVWIEIKVNELSEQNSNKSLPSRKCGLKYDDFCCQTEEEGHFLRGSVD